MATTFFEDLMKKKPKVPEWKDIDPTQIQRDTVSGNIASLDEARALAAKYDEYTVEQLNKRLAATFPEWEGLQTAGASVIASRLRGELGMSDAAESQRRSAARALGLGIAGSPAGGALTLRDLGLTQYQAQSEALAALPGFAATVGNVKAAPRFDFASMFLSPTQRWQMVFSNQENQWNAQWLKNQVKAQPSGVLWAMAKQFDQDIEMAKQAAISYFSKGMASGGGGSVGYSGPGEAPTGWGGLSPAQQRGYNSQVSTAMQYGRGINFE